MKFCHFVGKLFHSFRVVCNWAAGAILLTFVLLPATASARQCSDVDLTPEIGLPQDQENSGWCYAYTAADLINYRYRNELKHKKISPVYVALLNNKFAHFNSIGSSGITAFATQLSLRYGSCLQDLENEFLKKTYSFVDKFKRLKALKDMFDGKSQILFEKSLQEFISESNNPRLNSDTLRTLLKESTSRDFLTRFADYICADNKWKAKEEADLVLRYPHIELDGFWRFVYSDFMTTIDQQLDRANIVGISYNVGPLRDSAMIEPHASTIIGRRWNNQTSSCEYLIRNSWGTSCYSYSPYYRKRCTLGNVWVDETFLKTSIGQIDYFKN